MKFARSTGLLSLSLATAVIGVWSCADKTNAPAAVPDPAHSILSVSSSTLPSGTSAIVTLQLRDAQDRRLSKSGENVVIVMKGGTSQGTLSGTRDNGDGSYAATFMATLVGTPRAFGASINGQDVTSALPTIATVPGPPSVSQTTMQASAPSVISGSDVTLTVRVRDAAGNALATGGATVVFKKLGGTSDGTIGPTTDNGNGTYTSAYTGTTVGSARTIGATLDGAEVTSTQPTILTLPGPASAARSTIEVSAPTVQSGASITLTLRAKDASGNDVTSGGATVVFTKGTGTSDGTISATTDNGNGTYTATFTGTSLGTARTIGATINGSPVATTLPTVTTVPGAPSAAQSTVQVSASSVASGSTATLTLRARDAAGNALSSGGATVAFALGAGTSSGTVSGTTDAGDGTYTATFTATTAGSARTITATLNGVAVTSTLPTITTTPGPASAAQSTIQVSASTVQSGGVVTLTLRAKDAAGNSLTTGGATVVFTLGAGTSGGTLSATTDNGDGTYTATFTGTTAGTPRSIGATLNGVAIGTALPTVTTVIGGVSPAQSVVEVSAAAVKSGFTATLTLRAKDATGNAIATGGATVVFQLGAGTSGGGIGGTTDHNDGTYTATFTATTVGTARTIGATINGATVTTTLPTITTTPGDASSTQSTVETSAASVASGATATLTLHARDAAGNALTSGGSSVLFVLGTGTSGGIIGATADHGDGSYTATFTATTVGTPRVIGATIDGVSVSSTLPAITTLPGAASATQSVVETSVATLASGSTTTVTLRAKDALGNALTTGGLTVAFTLGSGTSAGTFSGTTDAGNGTYTATYTATIAGTARTIGATINGNAVTTTLPTITTTPGPVSLSQSTVETSAATIESGTTATFTLRARDAAGNALTAGGLTVVFTKGAGTSDGTIGPVADHADGTYTATFTATTPGTARSISATIGGNAVASTPASITVTPPAGSGVISPATSIVTLNNGSVVSGATLTITLQGKDGLGANMTTGGATVVFSLASGTSTASIGPVTDHANGTYSATLTGTLVGTPRAVAATINGTAVTTTQPTFSVTPGAVSPATSVVSIANGTIASGASTTITLQAKDAATNNLVSGGATVAFALAVGGTSSGAIGSVTDNGNGTYSATLTGATAGTPRAISATINAAAVTTAQPTFTVTAGAISAATSLVTVASATVASGASTTITLHARDAAGNNLSTGGANVAFALGAGTSTGTIGAVTDNLNGLYTASFTGLLVGTARNITATIGGMPVSTTPPTITVTPGAVSAATSIVSLSNNTVASGATITATLQARDAANNNLTSGGATVVFSLTGAGTSTGTFGAVTDNANGTYSALLTGGTVGTPRAVAATVNTVSVATPPPSFTVTAGAISAATSLVSLGSSSFASGSSTTVTLQAKDAGSNNLTTGGATVVFSLSGVGTSTGAFSAVTDHSNGTYTATLTGVVAGTAKAVAATVNGLAVGTTLPTFTVTPGPVSAATSVISGGGLLASGASTTITLQAKDAANNNLTTGGATVVFSFVAGGTSTGTFGTVTDNANGTYSVTLTAVAPGTARGIGATINGVTVTTTAPTFTVTPGVISTTTSTVALSNSTVVSGNSITITLQAKDANGNNISTGGANVAFALGITGTSTGTIGSVTDNGNGTYTASLTGVLAGTARTIAATIGGTAVTTTQPSFTVTPGAPSAATSVISAAVSELVKDSSTTLTLQTKDAAGNNITTGGATVTFGLGTGTSNGTIGPVTNPGGGGSYQATFTATAEGTPRAITATVNGNTVTTGSPTILVYVKGLTLSTTSVLANATAGEMGATQFVAIFANGGKTAAGMAAAVSYTTPSIAACQSTNWLGAPVFDFTTANPVSVVSFTPTAALLGVYTCTANVTISSTTPGYASQTFSVSLAVARGAIAQTAVNLVTMGNAGQNFVQDLQPYARVVITNGGRGIVSGVHATVSNQSGVGINDPTPWLLASDLTWTTPRADTNARTLPDTLIVRTRAAPFSATATIHVTGIGITSVDIPVNILFNVEPELVTNPRGAVMRAFVGGTSVQLTLRAFNQNVQGVSDSLRNYARDLAIAIPSWLSVSVTPLQFAGMDTAANVTLTANPASLLADSVYTGVVGLKADKCQDNFDGTCFLPADFNPVKTFSLPVTLKVERGLVVPVTSTTMFAASGTTTVTRDIPITNGGSTSISGLSVNLGGAAWLSSSFIGGTAAPTTLRLTANPTGFAKGTVLNTTVTVSASTPSGVPSKSFTVAFRVY